MPGALAATGQESVILASPATLLAPKWKISAKNRHACRPTPKRPEIGRVGLMPGDQIHPGQPSHPSAWSAQQRLPRQNKIVFAELAPEGPSCPSRPRNSAAPVQRRAPECNCFRMPHVPDPNFLSQCIQFAQAMNCNVEFQSPIWTLRGWRGQVPRQPGQIRKEAATTSPTWVDVQPLTLPNWPVRIASIPCGVYWTNAGAACSI